MSHKRSTPTALSDSTNQPTNLIDDYALDRIEFRAGRLARLFRLCDDDVDDLRQELALELVKAAARFDPDTSSRRTFINRALDRRYRHIYRRLQTAQRHEAFCPSPASLLKNFNPVVNDPHSGELSEQERAELHIDLAPAISSLPRHLQEICELLKTHSPREAAEQLGVHRSTIYRAMQEIRSRFIECGLDESA